MHGAAAKEALLATPASIALCGAVAAFCDGARRHPAPVRENASLAACVAAGARRSATPTRPLGVRIGPVRLPRAATPGL